LINKSKSGMIRRSPNKLPPLSIHSRLEPDDHERLSTLADQQGSSVARIVKLAVIANGCSLRLKLSLKLPHACGEPKVSGASGIRRVAVVDPAGRLCG
jgi:hypothetical protein